MWLILSHKISSSTPSYDDGPRLQITPHKQILKGDSSNSYFIYLPNHLGTHVDAPFHFDPNGRKISSFTLDELIFTNPLLLDVEKKELELITLSDLRPHEEAITRADLLLLRTGFQRYRADDPTTYMKRGPCLAPDAAEYLRKFDRLRGLGVDMISISSPAMRELGRESHRKLLVGRSFLIIEDMDLLNKPSQLKKVIVAPLMVEDVDSSPCTVLAEV